jgi:hypothetical protein
MAIEAFFKEKVFDRFFLKAQSLVQNSSLRGSKLEFSVLSKALNSQNFRKYLNDYFGFVKKRNYLLDKVLSPYLSSKTFLFFLKNSHLPSDKFFLVNKFMETEDLFLRLQRCGLFSSTPLSCDNHFERFINLYVDLLKELGPRGNTHEDNKNMFSKFLQLHFLDSDVLKNFAERKMHDVYKLSDQFKGFSQNVSFVLLTQVHPIPGTRPEYLTQRLHPKQQDPLSVF